MATSAVPNGDLNGRVRRLSKSARSDGGLGEELVAGKSEIVLMINLESPPTAHFHQSPSRGPAEDIAPCDVRAVPDSVFVAEASPIDTLNNVTLGALPPRKVSPQQSTPPWREGKGKKELRPLLAGKGIAGVGGGALLPEAAASRKARDSN